MALPSIKNSVGMAVTAVASAGVGTLTVGAALSGGYQTAATAYGANANIDIRIEEGDTWEVCRDCTYTHSELTVTRGTQEDGSSGTSTRVAFTSAAKVYVVESAERMRRTVGGYLEHSSHDGTAAVTGVVGTMHVFTALTADRNFTLPASAQAGDRIGITFPAGSANYEILLKSASGDKINNVDCSSTEWSRLFIAGETVIFRCVDASTVDWIVEYDGRVPCVSYVLSGEFTHTSSGNYQEKGFGSGYTVSVNTGGLVNEGGGSINIRRAGKYLVTGALSFNSINDQKAIRMLIKVNDSGGLCFNQQDCSNASIAYMAIGRSESAQLAVGDSLTMYILHTDSASETGTFQIGVTENI